MEPKIKSTKAISIKCPLCEANSYDMCLGGELHQTRINEAIRITRDINKVIRDFMKGKGK